MLVTMPASVAQTIIVFTKFRYSLTLSTEVQMVDIDDLHALDAVTDAFDNWHLEISDETSPGETLQTEPEKKLNKKTINSMAVWKERGRFC